MISLIYCLIIKLTRQSQNLNKRIFEHSFSVLDNNFSVSVQIKTVNPFDRIRLRAEPKGSRNETDIRRTCWLPTWGPNVCLLWCLCVACHLVYEQRACYFRAGVLRVDHRDAPSGRSVIYCLNRNVSCYFLLAECWNQRSTFTNHFIYNVLSKLHRVWYYLLGVSLYTANNLFTF